MSTRCVNQIVTRSQVGPHLFGPTPQVGSITEGNFAFLLLHGRSDSLAVRGIVEKVGHTRDAIRVGGGGGPLKRVALSHASTIAISIPRKRRIIVFKDQ